MNRASDGVDDNAFQRACQEVTRMAARLNQACIEHKVPQPGEDFTRFPINFAVEQFDLLVDRYEYVLIALRHALRLAPANPQMLDWLTKLRQWRRQIDHHAQIHDIVEHEPESEDDDALFTSYRDVSWPPGLPVGRELRATLFEHLDTLRAATTPAARQRARTAAIAAAQKAWVELPLSDPDDNEDVTPLTVADKLDRLILSLQDEDAREAAENAVTISSRKRKREALDTGDEALGPEPRRRRGDDGGAIPLSAPHSTESTDRELKPDDEAASSLIPDHTPAVPPATRAAGKTEAEKDWPAGWPSSGWSETRQAFLDMCASDARGNVPSPKLLEWAEVLRAALEAEGFDGEAAERRDKIVAKLDELIKPAERPAPAQDDAEDTGEDVEEDTGSSSGSSSAQPPADPLADTEFIWPSTRVEGALAALRAEWVNAYLAASTATDAARWRERWGAVAAAAEEAINALRASESDDYEDLFQRLSDHRDAVQTLLRNV